ncbi:MAG: hypothetical protein ACLGI6_24025, partial [Gammaproteobacteria bacterium]
VEPERVPLAPDDGRPEPEAPAGLGRHERVEPLGDGGGPGRVWERGRARVEEEPAARGGEPAERDERAGGPEEEERPVERRPRRRRR